MSKCVIRVAQVATPDLFLSDRIKAGRELYHTKALQLAPNPKVLVNHDERRPIGRVVALEEWPEAEGVWVFARCELTETPEWLRGGAYNGTGASMAWIDLGTSQELPGGWRRFNRGMVTEVSVLSPSVKPAETRAKVVILQRHPTGELSHACESSPERDGDVVLHGDGRSLHRYFETPITIR